jgi:hypothetical protein
MMFCDHVNGPRSETVLPCGRSWLRLCLIGALAAIALGGCSLEDGPGTLMVDPGRYSVYHCNDLSKRWTELRKREKELRSLMDKASEGGGGTVIGALAYRSDYETTLTEEKLVQREAAEKKCDLSQAFQSDQDIH